ncbi:MAG: cell division protein ZapA [Prevotellaceae bacterium]|jgi:cell division protein ZapA|nr:cell division protein ZapA [Prevotellaceae bacterium]
MEEEKFSIKVSVAERYYAFKIAASGEERLRAAARRINEMVVQYQQNFTDRDMRDFLSMAAMRFVVNLIEYETAQGRIANEAAVLNEELGEYLQRVE